ncbi:MAG: hypothetical protein EHM72_14530 [Calditrichaeota bacterium]|nr:MAG: hypothetical protein EHM72_14530 [Calditrichota bacterium]
MLFLIKWTVQPEDEHMAHSAAKAINRLLIVIGGYCKKIFGQKQQKYVGRLGKYEILSVCAQPTGYCSHNAIQLF